AEASSSFVQALLAQLDGNDSDGRSALEPKFEEACSPEREVRDSAVQALETALSPEHAQRLTEIREAEESEHLTGRPPRFDLGKLQRYILKRVFDLGWTVERFGHFDRFVARHDGRDASKPERIGKKYQWIAYHEVMALLSDHFQYRED